MLQQDTELHVSPRLPLTSTKKQQFSNTAPLIFLQVQYIQLLVLNTRNIYIRAVPKMGIAVLEC